AVHPDLGTIEDFDFFVAKAREQGLEVALDLALQCSPDHPWVTEHPEWFNVRADGSIAYAENPPKKYQHIYPINFDHDPERISREVLRVVNHWIDHGVTIFRVDNPPDILHAYLQYGGPPAFKIRAALAALLSPSWGVYSGFELFEHVAVRPGSEEYIDSEKYQYRPRDWAKAEREGRTLAPFLTKLNAVRRAHPALHQLRNLRWHN